MQISTNGSKVDEKVAAAAVSSVAPNSPFSCQLRDHCSIYTAELQAILFALKQAYQSQERKFMIFFRFTIRFTSALKIPRSGELRTQKLKSHLVRTQCLNVLPLKVEVGQYIAIHATLTARDFFLAYFYPSGPFTCIGSKTSPNYSCVGSG